MQHVRRRRNRVAAVDKRLAGQLGSRDTAQGEGRVAVDDTVVALRCLRRRHAELNLERLVDVARLEGPQVRLGHGRELAELLGDPLATRLHRPIKELIEQPECEEVLAATLRLDVELDTLERGKGQGGDRESAEPKAIRQRRVVEGIFVVACLGKFLLVERVLVDEQLPAGLEPPQVDLERRRVHGHQHVGAVTRRMGLFAGEAELEG